MTDRARVLVMGATGQVGGALIPNLAKHEDLDRISMATGYTSICCARART